MATKRKKTNRNVGPFVTDLGGDKRYDGFHLKFGNMIVILNIALSYFGDSPGVITMLENFQNTSLKENDLDSYHIQVTRQFVRSIATHSYFYEPHKTKEWFSFRDWKTRQQNQSISWVFLL